MFVSITRVKCPNLSVLRWAICAQVWPFTMTLGPFQCMRRMLHCSNPQTGGLAWSDLQFIKHFSRFISFSMAFTKFYKIPWFFPGVLLFFNDFQDEWESWLLSYFHFYHPHMQIGNNFSSKGSLLATAMPYIWEENDLGISHSMTSPFFCNCEPEALGLEIAILLYDHELGT